MRPWKRRSILNTALAWLATNGIPKEAFPQLADAASTQPSDHPVYFWNARALELVALDHSITASTSVAPGPCASSRALGAIHAVIADAVAHAYLSPFAPYFNTKSPGSFDGDPALFVGGAAYAYMKYIYNTPVFSDVILNPAMSDFIGLFPGSTKEKMVAWDAGVSFGSSAEFTRLWNAALIKALLKSDPASYKPANPTTAHRPDPWNPSQGYYGQKWGTIEPLVLGQADVGNIARNELKVAPDVDQDELNLLLAKGSRVAGNVGTVTARTKSELNVGLFWAYDGVRLLGTPPVLLNKAVAAVAAADKLDIPGVARLFALCNLAMADAAVVAWEAKWRLALWRPVVAIQALTAEKTWQPYGSPRSNRGRYFPTLAPANFQDVVENIDEAEAQDTAVSLLGASPAASFTGGAGAPPDPAYARAAFTPNFPSYPSGHATFGGACFESLLLARSEHGNASPNDINIKLTSGELDGVTTDNYVPSRRRDNVPMTFTGVVQHGLANQPFDLKTLTGEIDASRIFLGVHWSFDQRDGDIAGRKVGDLVYSKAYVFK